MTSPLEWTLLASDIGARSLAETRHATNDERVEVARALDLLSCESLAASFEVIPLSAGRFRFKGELAASVTQACVVTLEPVPATVEESFDIELRPEAESDGDPSEGDQEILAAPDVEPIIDGRIEAGDMILAVLSAALPQYPRKEGAEFDWKDPKAAESPANPFAVLAKLGKDR